MIHFADHFAGKTVVVTGAGKGVGRALATSLHGLGAKVYAVTRTRADLDKLVAECPGIHPIQLDISNWDETKRVLNEQIPKIVNVLINNAGVLSVQRLLVVEGDEVDRILSTNVKAVINVTQVCVAKMIAAGTSGIVVNVSSIGGARPLVTCPVYSASKAALDALTKTMAVDFGKHKIRVVALSAGVVDTDMTSQMNDFDPEMRQKFLEMTTRFPLGEMMLPMEQVVSTILFLGSGIAGMMTGSSVILDGGFCAT